MTRLMGELPRPAVLYLAALLHDIGKGWRQGDHSGRGAKVAEAVGRRFEAAGLMSWTAEETDDLVWLVKEHLTMSTLSQRRDLEDRSLVQAFADGVKSRERLAMLYLLTFADMRGTSPKVWTEWKGSLLAQLHRNARAVMEATADHEHQRRMRAQEELIREEPELAELARAFIGLAPTRYVMSFQPKQTARHVRMWSEVSAKGGFALRVSHKKRDDVTVVTIACPDRQRLLALLAGTLAANSLQILSAQIFSLGKVALDVLYVKDADGRICEDPHRWDRVREDLERVIAAEDVETLLDTRVHGSTLAQRVRPDVETKVVIADDASERETVIDVFCQDHLGVLHAICTALADQGLSISLAKISTEGNRVADGFYVTDAETGEKITDPARLESIKQAVEQAVRARDGRVR
jgi:[protein-PII] uridylyltransferase